MNSIFYNGRILPAGEPVLQAGNRAFQYGDGLFETMRIHQGKIILAHYHFDRLFSGMQAMLMEIPSWFTRQYLQDSIRALCQTNGHLSARVRLTVFRQPHFSTENSLDQPSVLIESWPLTNGYVFREEQFSLGISSAALKCADPVSRYKTAAYLPYALAAISARQQGVDDCLVLNTESNPCDTSIANLFILNGEVWETPHLSEGCVNGVMRQHIINNISKTGFAVIETAIDIEMLLSADEVFLTNVIRGIQPVTSCLTINYPINFSRTLFEMLVKPLTTVEQSAA